MDHDFIVNQVAWLLTGLTPIACKKISLAIADMAEDSVEIAENSADPFVLKTLIGNVRSACENND